MLVQQAGKQFVTAGMADQNLEIGAVHSSRAAGANNRVVRTSVHFVDTKVTVVQAKIRKGTRYGHQPLISLHAI